MDRTNILRCIRDRAHLAGAESVILEKQADALAEGPLPDTIYDCSEDQLRALLLAQQANIARRRYYRELEAINLLLGRDTAHFAGLT